MKVLCLTFPTFDDEKTLMINARRDLLCPAIDGIVSELLKLGHQVVCVNLATLVHNYSEQELNCPGFISGMKYVGWNEVTNKDFDLIWHAVKDPTPEIVLDKIRVVMQGLSRDIPVINNVESLKDHDKRKYLKVLCERKVGAKIADFIPAQEDLEKANPTREGAFITKDHKFVRVWLNNSTRGDLFSDKFGITLHFVDTTKLESSQGFRTMFRVPYAEGKCLKGFKYYCPADILCPKTGAAARLEEYEVPEGSSVQIGLAMKEIGVNLAHIEGFETNGSREVAVFDVNPFPSSSGKTLTPMSVQIAKRLEQVYDL